mgnify:CR=1 FL=1
MEYNQNDYVVVNGKRYYAMGGDTNNPHKIPDKKAMLEYIESYLRNKEIDENGNPKYMTDFGDTVGSYTPSPYAQSQSHGQSLFNKYSPEIQEKIKQGRMYWANELQRRIDDGWGDYLKEKYNITQKDINDFRKNNWDDTASQKINYYMSQRYPNFVLPDKKTPGKVLSGDNVFWALAATSEVDDRTRPIKAHWDELSKMGYGYDYITNPNKSYTVHKIKEGPNEGSYIYALYDDIKNPNPTIAIKTRDGKWSGYVNTYNPKLLNVNAQQYSNVYDLSDKAKLQTSTRDYRSEKNNILHNKIMPSNQLGLKFAQTVEGWAKGGRTSRLYATGGTMGDIPLGEQPNDYNMINEGGTHEENPMGGVPYGVNQDGSQNMVEEGEVTVGDNVYSDRVELSPDLCQQLGLPQGTTPAQAMQQIEQLYEQGQLQDEEYQEISDIIFQDQENQKQGGEQGAPPEGMEQPPAEGLDPSQLQGGAMPPEMMQGAPMPPEAMQGAMPPQQGAPMPPQEGITPDMVQGGSYAYGGYMRRRF